MKFKQTGLRAFADQRARAAFTLVEVLAALLFMAIVIPVAVQGLRVANLAGQVGERKAAAIRVADKVLNEMILTQDKTSTTQRGTVQDGPYLFQWQSSNQPWNLDSMRVVTVQVNFDVQGRDQEVRLTTLMENAKP